MGFWVAAEQANFYEVLEITPDASPQEIREAYIRLKGAFNRESVALYSLVSTEQTNNHLALIEKAYEILSHPDRRRSYDQNHADQPDIVTSENVESPLAPVHRLPEKSSLGPKPASPNEEYSSLIDQECDWRGTFIRKIRELKNIPVEELAQETKINKNYLIAIEAEDFGKLPASVFLRGFLVQIARYLKLPAEPMANAYIARYRLARPDN